MPAETPVTDPEPSIVATAGLEELHAFDVAGVPLPFNWVVRPAQTAVVPVITGLASTVTTAVV